MRNLATMYFAEHNVQDIGLEMGIGHACKSLSEGAIELGIDSSMVEQIKGIWFYARECAEGAYELDDDNKKTTPSFLEEVEYSANIMMRRFASGNEELAKIAKQEGKLDNLQNYIKATWTSVIKPVDSVAQFMTLHLSKDQWTNYMYHWLKNEDNPDDDSGQTGDAIKEETLGQFKPMGWQYAKEGDADKELIKGTFQLDHNNHVKDDDMVEGQRSEPVFGF